MDSEKKARNMTVRGFLAKTNSKAATSASAFISQYRDYLTTGELAPLTAPIVAKVESGTLMPTPALAEIQNAVLTHMILLANKELEATEGKVIIPSKKVWKAKILDGRGNICVRIKENGEAEELDRSFEHASEADRWVDRNLVECGSDCHGEIDHATMNIHTIVLRQDAMARVFKAKKGPTIHHKSKTTATLGFGVKCSQDRASFSKG